MTVSPTAPRWRIARIIGVALLLAGLYGVGLGLRRHVLAAQTPPYGPALPFTLESALQYRHIRMIYLGEPLPALDPMVEHPDGVRTFENDTVGAEYVCAFLARLFPATVVLPDRVRWIEAAWFCVGIILLAWWVRRMTGSWTAGGLSGFTYAVSLGALLRSTGQEISHENFALPLLIAHLALSSGTREKPGAPPVPPGRGALWMASALLGLALMTWDLIQFYVLLWVLWRLTGWFRRPCGLADPRMRDAGPVATALIACGALNPYLRAHGFLLSPIMALLYALLAGLMCRSLPAGRTPPAWVARAAAAAVFAGVLACHGAYVESYAHFAELLWAKIRFLNRKPADPALLTFTQRILWTPALHSASPGLILMMFPYVLPLTTAALVVLFSRIVKQAKPSHESTSVLVFHVVSFLAFVLFVRFCVFVAIFASAVLGLWAAAALRESRWRRWIVPGLIAASATAEWVYVAGKAPYWGAQLMFYPQMLELKDWLKNGVAPQPVLANFQTSGFVLAYGNCPVVLHPKFEAPRIREKVEQYGRLLFTGTERGLRDWADGFGVKHLVYSMGEFAEKVEPQYQMRYMVDALDPPDHAPARLFEFAPDRLALFDLTCSNVKYRVFRILTASEEAEVQRMVDEAETALQNGRPAEAEARAAEAVKRWPRHRKAVDLLAKSAALRGSVGQP